VVLGILSIVAFGGWFYGYGVLVEDLAADTGWSETVISSTYGLSLLVTGVGALAGGRMLDRSGSRRLFLGAALLSTGALLLAATTRRPLVFAIAAVIGGGVVGAAGYYQATQAVMARLAPEQRARGITALTLWGALASPVALPLIGWLVQSFGWRVTLRLIALVVGSAFLAAATLLPDVRAPATVHVGWRTALLRGWRDPVVRRMLLAAGFAGTASSVLLLNQVPVMVDAGMALTLASTLAGARGLAQLLGRIPLPAVVARVGTRATLRGAYVLTAVGALLLLGSGQVAVALVFVLVAGVAIGALAAAEGIYASEVVDQDTLATQMGVQSLLRGIGSAVGPIGAGVLVDATGTRTSALVLAAVAAVTAAAMLTRRD